MATLLSSASRESLAAAGNRLDAEVDRAPAAELAQLGDDLFAVLRLLTGEISLRRHLADPSVPAGARVRAGRPAVPGQDRPIDALDVVSDLVRRRWSRAGDLVEALEQLARRAVLGVAEKDQSLDDVEDELFRFGRILDREPQLGSLLADEGAPADKRAGLLREVLGGRVTAGHRRRCSSRRCAPRGGAAWTGRPRSCPSWPRPAGTATWRTCAPRCGCRPTRSTGSPSRCAGSTTGRSRCRSSSTRRCSAAWSSGSAAT